MVGVLRSEKQQKDEALFYSQETFIFMGSQNTTLRGIHSNCPLMVESYHFRNTSSYGDGTGTTLERPLVCLREEREHRKAAGQTWRKHPVEPILSKYPLCGPS